MKFSYKEKQDLIWSLDKNAERLSFHGRVLLDEEGLMADSENPEGVKRVREEYKKTMESYDRLVNLANRLENER